MTPTNKTCYKCRETKPDTEYYKDRKTLTTVCKTCLKERDKLNRRKRKYGLSAEAFEALWIEAASKCAICASTLTSGTHNHAIDHNHQTGEVRGLLCGFCNKGLGQFKDNPQLLRAAASYLEVRGHYGGA